MADIEITESVRLPREVHHTWHFGLCLTFSTIKTFILEVCPQIPGTAIFPDYTSASVTPVCRPYQGLHSLGKSHPALSISHVFPT